MYVNKKPVVLHTNAYANAKTVKKKKKANVLVLWKFNFDLADSKKGL